MIYREGNLLTAEQARLWLEKAPNHMTGQIDLCTAYLKNDALVHVLKGINERRFIGNMRILTRWQHNDLMTGASDFIAYETAKEIGAEFFIKLNFHGKIYRVSDAGIVLGSANLTSSGFGLRGNDGNDECCTLFRENDENIRFLNDLFERSFRVNDLLYSKLIEYGEHTIGKMNKNEWPDNILNFFKEDVEIDGLFIDELFFSNAPHELLASGSSSRESLHDSSLLNLGREASILDIKYSFIKSKPFAWLLSLLKNRNNNEIYFGELSAQLHGELLDDPVPRRGDVKILTANLINWVDQLGGDYIKIDRPNYSQRIYLVE